MSKTAAELLAILNNEIVSNEIASVPLTETVAAGISFDELVVNSLDALHIALLLEEASGKEISLQDLRACPSVMHALHKLSGAE